MRRVYNKETPSEEYVRQTLRDERFIKRTFGDQELSLRNKRIQEEKSRKEELQKNLGEEIAELREDLNVLLYKYLRELDKLVINTFRDIIDKPYLDILSYTEFPGCIFCNDHLNKIEKLKSFKSKNTDLVNEYNFFTSKICKSFSIDLREIENVKEIKIIRSEFF